MPNLCAEHVKPSDERLDLDRLKKDLPKFTNHSTVFENVLRQWWDHFMNITVPDLFTEKDRPTRWPLDDLVEIKQRQRTARTMHYREGGIGLAAIPRPADVPDMVNALVEGQIDGVPEVSLFLSLPCDDSSPRVHVRH